MILAGHQPNYLPNLAYFAKMQQADVFVVTTNLQFVRDKEWHRRNHIPGPHGDIWLTVPVTGGSHQILRDVRVRDDLPWRYRHAETLKSLYGNTAGSELLPLFTQVYERTWDRLVDLNYALIERIASILEISTSLVLDEDVTGIKEELITNVCEKYQADKYLSGAGGRLYMGEAYWDTLARHDITPAFVERDLSRLYPYSVLHYLLAYGAEWTRRVVHSQIRLSGYQPQYFPRLHYMARMLDSDIFTISDNVQFVKNHLYPTATGKPRRGKSYQADTPIKLSGGMYHLTVPIKHEGEGLKAISQTKIAYERSWVDGHLQTLAVTYARAKNFSRVFPQLQQLLTVPYDTIAQLNTATLIWALHWILGRERNFSGTATPASLHDLLARPHPFRLRQVVFKSDLDALLPRPVRDATDSIVERCKILGAHEYYLGGTAHQTYIDDKRFQQAHLRLVEQDWACQPYEQLFPKLGFMPNLSILDLIFNEDRERLCQVLQGEKIAERVSV